MMDLKQILTYCDHTELRQTCTPKDIVNLVDEAIAFHTASVCIPPCYVKQAAEYAQGRIPICTVIGFPNGYSATVVKKFEATQALIDGATELDLVINLGALRNGNYSYVYNEISEIKGICGSYILKVIIETCLLTEQEKITMCRLITEAGADFIKTSTGFSKAGATLQDVRLFKEHVGERVKIKAAGGIRTPEEAQQFLDAGAVRLGTSSLVKIAKELLG